MLMILETKGYDFAPLEPIRLDCLAAFCFPFLPSLSIFDICKFAFCLLLNMYDI